MREYKFDTDAKKYSDLPFRFEDVQDIKPILKNIQVHVYVLI